MYVHGDGSHDTDRTIFGISLYSTRQTLGHARTETCATCHLYEVKLKSEPRLAENKSNPTQDVNHNSYFDNFAVYLHTGDRGHL